MAYQFFVVPVRSSESDVEELNRFLRGHRVLTIDRRWVEQGWESFWSLCVEYLETSPGGAPFKMGGSGSKPPIDYQQVLSPEDFAVFAKLRTLRASLAKDAAVPTYTIFNNVQLAEIAKSRPATKAELGKIDGVGTSRVEKYGERFLAIVAEAGAPAESV